MHGSMRRASLGGDGGAANDKRATPRNTKALHKEEIHNKTQGYVRTPTTWACRVPDLTNTITQLK